MTNFGKSMLTKTYLFSHQDKDMIRSQYSLTDKVQKFTDQILQSMICLQWMSTATFDDDSVQIKLEHHVDIWAGK